MSEFETFYLKFEAETSQFKKELADVQKRLDEFTDTSKESETQTKKTDNEFSKLAGTLSKVAAGYFSIGAVIGGFKNALANTANIGDLSRKFGLDPQKADAFGKALKNLGYDAQAATSELLEFANTNLTLPDVALSYLPELGERLRAQFPTVAQAQAYGRQSGFNLGPELIAALYNTSDLQERIAEQERLGVVSPEDIAATRKFDESLSKLANAFDELYRVIFLKLVPDLEKLADRITGVFKFLSGDGVDKFYEEQRKESQEAKDAQARILNDIFGGWFTGIFESGKGKQRLLFGNGFDDRGIDFSDNLGERYQKALEKEMFGPQAYVPTVISPMSNSQASNFSFNGDVNINTTARDTKEIATSIVGEIGNQSRSLLAQLQQSNAYYDDGIMI